MRGARIAIKYRARLSGSSALFFFALTLILIKKGSRLEFGCNDWWIEWLGFGVILDAAYLSIHFMLKTLLFESPALARAWSRALAALVAVPLTLMAVVLSFVIAVAALETGNEIFDYTVDFTSIQLTLTVPAFFLWRHALKAPADEPGSYPRTTPR